MKKAFSSAAIVVLLLTGFCRIALAHAVLMTSNPAVHGKVHGPSIDVDLKFNSRVDGAHSQLTLVMPDGKTQPVSLSAQHGANELTSHLNLQHGSYTLRWQALSSDGHISRGEIPFSVE
ncbi:copper resistance CopC family protein [Silvibacterium acidisoli]|uniref:copper resistance CopC family protein n=1 Tax=Acidobacteriaceae bacterium ZG23-2 TaxID=2883246 RepID=UPI00406C590A